MEVCEVTGDYADYVSQSGNADHDVEFHGTPLLMGPEWRLSCLTGSSHIVSTSGSMNSFFSQLSMLVHL